jgi:cell pole-organizing protein PopZ
MSMTNKPVEPSMEEILASIRKIIAEEPIGTRPDPVHQQAGKAAPRSDGGPKRSPMLEALAIDDVVDMAGGAGQSPGAGGRSASTNGAHGGASGQDKRAAPQSTQPVEATVTTGNGAARAEEAKPAADARSPDALGATVPGRKAELDTPPERPAAQSVDAVLSEAQKKVDRHFGSLPEPAERPAPLGLRSIRDPLRDVKAAAGSLTSRVAAATQAAAEPVVDKVRVGNGAAGAATTVAGAPAKQAETTAAKTDATAAKATAQTTAATPTPVSAAQSESTKPAAGQSKASLEEAVAEMLRPMLNTWLEANLPRIVEQVVREHVAKTPLPGKDKPAV